MATTELSPLSLRRFEGHPWQAADVFRNKVSNQKDYILVLPAWPPTILMATTEFAHWPRRASRARFG